MRWTTAPGPAKELGVARAQHRLQGFGTPGIGFLVRIVDTVAAVVVCVKTPGIAHRVVALLGTAATLRQAAFLLGELLVLHGLLALALRFLDLVHLLLAREAGRVGLVARFALQVEL